jgi:aminoacrylate peracid reductase
MPKVAIAPAGYPAIAPYSPGVKVGNTLYISGTLALDPEGKTVDPTSPPRLAWCWS